MIHPHRPSNPEEGEICYENGRIEIFTNGKWCQFSVYKDISSLFDKKKEKRMKAIKSIFEQPHSYLALANDDDFRNWFS